MAKTMDAAVKQQWVAALRSGEYRQTVDSLRNRSGHCCLGVLCDLYVAESGKRWGFAGMKWGREGSFTLEDELPGAEVCIWAGLPLENPSVTIKGKKRELSWHNDDGRTFAEIADAIEAQL